MLISLIKMVWYCGTKPAKLVPLSFVPSRYTPSGSVRWVELRASLKSQIYNSWTVKQIFTVEIWSRDVSNRIVSVQVNIRHRWEMDSCDVFPNSSYLIFLRVSIRSLLQRITWCHIWQTSRSQQNFQCVLAIFYLNELSWWLIDFKNSVSGTFCSAIYTWLHDDMLSDITQTPNHINENSYHSKTQTAYINVFNTPAGAPSVCGNQFPYTILI